MNCKKILFVFFMFFSFLLFLIIPQKISAINMSYCIYNEKELLLPVTIGVDVEVLNLDKIFTKDEKTFHNQELYIVDEQSCNQKLSIVDSFSSTNTIITTEYYYKYNDTKRIVDYIGEGIYQKVDLIKPTISTVTDYFLVDVDEELDFDSLSNIVYAVDETDGYLIPELNFENYSENKHILGDYIAKFIACDKSNNCNYTIIKISVVDRVSPTIEGIESIETNISNPIDLDTIKNNLIAKDNYDNDISEKIFLVSSDYNPKSPGKYNAFFSVKDSSNNEVIKNHKVEITILDDVVPSIEGPNKYISRLSNVISTKHILSNLIVCDNVEELSNDNIFILIDNYTNNTYKIGTYELIVSAYDNQGNESLPYKIEIEVIDDLSPTIEGVSSFNSYLSNPLSLLDIRSNLVVYDNHDGNLFTKLEILEDSYSFNKNNIGIYHLVFSVKDSSNNISEPFLVEINCYDDISPIIEGDTIYKTLITEKIDLSKIKSNLRASDNVDGEISNNISINEDNYSDNYNAFGTYYISFYVSDNSGNISNMFKVKIEVIENNSYIDTIKNSKIYFSTSNKYNQNEILNILKLNPNEYNSINLIIDNYSENYNIEGSYQLTFQVEHLDYSKETFNINVITYKEKEESNNNKRDEIVNPIKQEEKKETIFSKIASFFKNLFYSISSFFKNLFR